MQCFYVLAINCEDSKETKIHRMHNLMQNSKLSSTFVTLGISYKASHAFPPISEQ